MLSTRSRYALHALVYLACKKSKDPVRISEIAEASKLPRKFLESILSDLKKGGILDSKRGQRGGYLLAKSPKHIRLIEIVSLLDGPILLTPCSHESVCDECTKRGFCHLRKSFKTVNEATQAKLEGIRLITLVRSRSTVKANRRVHPTINRQRKS